MAVNEERIPVEREVRIDAPPDVIFKFFVDPEHMVRWKGVEAMLDPRPGGLYRVNVTGTQVARGEYLEVSPNERVVFTWGWEGPESAVPPGTSTVEITLRPEGSKTVVRLEHRDFASKEIATGHIEGWDHFLDRLAIAASGGDPGVDPWTIEGGK